MDALTVADTSETQIIFHEEPLERPKRAQIVDFIIILMIGVVAVILEFQLIAIEPYHQYIPILDNNPSSLINYNFAYPNLKESIGTTGLLMLCFLPWYLLFIISTILLYYMDEEFSWCECRKFFYLMNRMILLCFVVTLVVIDIIKIFCGSPRPYFLSIYDSNDKSEVLEGRLSFPSGHAGLAMAQLLLLTIMLYRSWIYSQNMYYKRSYIIGMKTYNPHSYYLCGFWWLLREIPLIAILLVFAPTFIAMYCGLTRIIEYKHFAKDVIGGMILGASIAYITYLIFYNEIYMRFNYRLQIKINSLNAKKFENKNENDPESNGNDNKINISLQQMVPSDAESNI